MEQSALFTFPPACHKHVGLHREPMLNILASYTFDGIKLNLISVSACRNRNYRLVEHHVVYNMSVQMSHFLVLVDV